MRNRVGRIVAACLLAAALLLHLAVFLAACRSAPAPLPRREGRSLDLSGEWTMTWNGSPIRYRFGRDGVMEGGGSWVGVWHFDGRTRLLTMRERIRWCPDAEYTVWLVSLDDSLAGDAVRVQPGSEIHATFRLQRPE